MSLVSSVTLTCQELAHPLIQADTRQYMLSDFPEYYKLYTRYTRRAGHIRCRQTFLMGTFRFSLTFICILFYAGAMTLRCSKFRSAKEFVLHAQWLANGRPRNCKGGASCQCRYCSGRQQLLISNELYNLL